MSYHAKLIPRERQPRPLLKPGFYFSLITHFRIFGNFKQLTWKDGELPSSSSLACRSTSLGIKTPCTFTLVTGETFWKFIRLSRQSRNLCSICESWRSSGSEIIVAKLSLNILLAWVSWDPKPFAFNDLFISIWAKWRYWITGSRIFGLAIVLRRFINE